MNTLLLLALIADPNPADILRAAARAGQNLKAVRYTVELDHFGELAKATVLEVRAPVKGGGRLVPAKYAVTGTLGSRTYRYSYDGTALRYQEEAGATVQTIHDPDDYELGQVLGQLPMASMAFLGGSFADWASSATLTYKGSKKVGKYECDWVEVKRKVRSDALGEMELTGNFAFDRATHLPVQSWSTGSKPVTVTSFELNPVVPSNAFEISGKAEVTSGPKVVASKLLDVGSVAPAFSLKDPSGRTVSLKSLKGKVVVLDFWGTWCQPCLRVMPHLQALHKKYASKGVVVLGIAVADNEGDPAGYMKRMKYTYGLLLKGDATAKAYKAVMLPTVYVIDKQGKIAYRQSGAGKDGDKALADAVGKLVK